MKNEARKLTLTRETLLPLQRTELGEVNGGVSPTVSVAVSASIRFCAAASRVVSAVSPAVSNSVANSTKPWVNSAKKVWNKINPFD